MAAFDFPNAPALNEVWTAPNGVRYQWNGYAWVPEIAHTVTGFMLWPAGIGITYWGLTLPEGTRWCDGAEYDPALYPALYAAIGAAYNTGGETAGWFRVPDSKGCAEIGRDDMGGTAAGRITVAGAGFDGKAIGARGGLQTHTLTSAQLAAHSHPYAAPAVVQLSGPGINYNAGAFSSTRTTSVTGGNEAHPNVQPSVVCNKLITTGGVS